MFSLVTTVKKFISLKTQQIATLLLIVILSLPLDVVAKIYKTVDEHGRVVFSDEPPSEQSAAEEITYNAKKPNFPELSIPRPILRTSDFGNIRVYLVDIAYDFDASKVVNYYLGENCFFKGRSHTYSKEDNYQHFIINSGHIGNYVSKVFKKYGYDARYPGKALNPYAQLIPKKEPTLFKTGLNLTFIDYSIDTCFKDKNKITASTQLSDFYTSWFEHSVIWFKIKWEIVNHKQEVLYTTFSEGTASSWDNHPEGVNGLNKKAFFGSVERALSNQEFIDALKKNAVPSRY